MPRTYAYVEGEVDATLPVVDSAAIKFTLADANRRNGRLDQWAQVAARLGREPVRRAVPAICRRPRGYIEYETTVWGVVLPRMTIPTQAVLGVLMAAEDEVFGLEIVRASGLGAGTVYPILQRLLAAGWVDARWEAPEQAHEDGRPPRRYYQLTAQGQARTVHVLQAGEQQRRSLARLLGTYPTPQPRLAPGT